MNIKKQDNKKRYIERRPDIPHEAFIFDYKQLLKKINSLRKEVEKNETSITNNDLVFAVGMAMRVRDELKNLCDKFLSDHPDEDNEILAHFLQHDSYYGRFAGEQHAYNKLKENDSNVQQQMKTENDTLKARVEALEREVAELKNAGHQEPPAP